MSALRFGRFELDAAARQLRVDGTPAALGARAFDVLLALVERSDRVVPKGELLDAVWPGLVVEENNLQVQVSALRRLLGAGAIATVPGRGYRFTLGVDGDAAASRAATTAPALDNLPGPVALIGRDDELRLALTALEAHRLVTVSGAGGIGKTSLALAAARAWRGRLADGVWWVELAPLDDARPLAAAVAQVLGLRVGAAPVADVVAALQSQRLLLVLDNAEHVLGGAAAFVRALLDAAPGVRVLVTSQQPLKLAAEQVLRLQPLAVPSDEAGADAARGSAALRLFVERVQRLDARFALDDAALADAVELCRRLDGLPLAIELAAARVPLLGVAGVRERLGARLRLLATSQTDAPARQRTLHAALDWSHALLGDAERVVLRRLAVFSGGFSVEAAQQVAADARLDEWAVLDALSALVERSLVTGGDRCTLLESTRAYAQERLVEAGEAATLVQRHARWYADHFGRLAARLYDGAMTEDAFIAARIADLDNLRAAVASSSADDGDLAVALALLEASAPLSFLISGTADFAAALQRVRTRLGDAATPAQRGALFYAGVLWWQIDGTDALKPRGIEALADIVEPRRRAFACCILSQNLRRGTEPHAGVAHALLDEAAALERPDWPRWLRARRVFSTVLQPDVSVPRERVAALLREFEAAGEGDGRSAFMLRENEAWALMAEGRYAEAAGRLQALLDDGRRRRRDSHRLTAVLDSLARCLLETRRLDEARTALRELLPHRRVTGPWQGGTLSAADYAAATGQHECAALLLGYEIVAYGRRSTGQLQSGGAWQRVGDRVRAAVAAVHGNARCQAWVTAGGALDDAAALRLFEQVVCG